MDEARVIQAFGVHFFSFGLAGKFLVVRKRPSHSNRFNDKQFSKEITVSITKRLDNQRRGCLSADDGSREPINSTVRVRILFKNVTNKMMHFAAFMFVSSPNSTCWYNSEMTKTKKKKNIHRK